MRLFALIFAFVVAAASNGEAKIKVVATTTDLAAIAAEIGEDRIDVTALAPAGGDPHHIEAKPSMIRKVHDANLLLAVGAELEIGWLPAILESARNPRVLPGRPGYLDLSESVVILEKPSGPVNRAMGDVHAGGNPHYWLDPENGMRMAYAIAIRLAEIDPVNASRYRQASLAFEQGLERKIADWRARLGWLRGKPAISYHRSFSYLAAAFGFHMAGEVEPLPGISPTASHIEQLAKRINEEKIGLLIMEGYFERRSARYLAERTGIRITILPHSVGSRAGIVSYSDLFETIVADLAATGR
ncbi:MAG: zinc ABC transporter substrate-binding protein [Alphaproteobacteria bacterium]|nr:zinc ABC transporter substrate-binding protein [Alphaproteobacteria bacterium]